MRQAGGHWLRFHRFHLAAAIGLAVGNGLHAQRLIHADASAVGANDGSSWVNAYVDLQDALDDVREVGGCPCEIWVAAGTYYPDRGTGDRRIAFELLNDVSIYGGFGGWEECRDERNLLVHETILNGDLGNNDDPLALPNAGCCDVASTEVCDDNACIALVNQADPSCATVGWRLRCFSLAWYLCCDACHPTRCDNSFNVLRAIDTDDSIVLDGLSIEGGQGIPELDDYETLPTGGLATFSSSVTVQGCTFRRNNGGNGSAMCAYGGPPTVVDSMFLNNEDSPAIFARAYLDAGIRIKNCTFMENAGGIDVIGGNSPIENCRFVRNFGPSIYQSGSTHEIVGCTFAENLYTAVISSWSILLRDCLFLGNRSPFGAGGVEMSGGNATVINSVFFGNQVGTKEYAGDGGAFKGIAGGVHQFINCTIVGNTATRWIGGIAGDAMLRNCILWGNKDQNGLIQQSQVSINPSGPLRVFNSIVQGWTGTYPGIATSSVEPLIVDPDGEDDIAGTEDDDLRLSPDSPAINAGDPNLAGLPINDLDGHFRVLCGAVDIGAYEFGIGDFTCDRKIGPLDAAELPSCLNGPDAGYYDFGCEAFDFDADADVDLRDAASFLRILE